ncbi:MAG: C4-type zinc ribbon domain-containing protein, partial [Actinomycetota bacterium]|nr:C4-type zinc ribbon domain-containing protein [Actinomycetota bacterium]
PGPGGGAGGPRGVAGGDGRLQLAVSHFDALLAVQAYDTAIDQLHHRRANLPARAELAEVERRAATVRTRLDDTRARRGEVLDRQSRLEEAVGAVDRRITELDARLYSGEVTASRELVAMTGEIDALKGRRSSLEDELLAAMEEDDPLAAEVAGIEQELAALASEADRLRRSIAEAEGEADAEMAGEQEARADAAAGVPSDLLARYEQLRARHGGVGAARLVGSSCSGCHLTLPAQELARIRREPPEALILCEQCGRILVR